MIAPFFFLIPNEIIQILIFETFKYTLESQLHTFVLRSKERYVVIILLS